MLVTTSRFQPKSRQFAVSADRKITLADSGHVAGWCAEVSAQLERYFQTGVLSPMLHLARDAAPGGMAGQVVAGCEGEGFENRQFWVVAHDFPREVILRPLAQRILWANQHDGEAVPDPDGAITDSRPKCLLAFKNEHGIEGSRWRFQRWDEKPVHLGGTD
jgi:hypothetical protein